MRRVLIIAVLTLSVVSQGFAAPPSPQVIRIGLLPHLSPKLLLETYSPLIAHLERRLGRRVVAKTARDFQTYNDRAESGHYDIYLTAPHMAALAAHRSNHHPLARFARRLHGVIVVAKDSPYQGLSELRGKTLATPDRLAVITLLGESTVAERGRLSVGRDIEILHLPSHNSAILAVAEGRADAAVAGVSAYEKMPTEVRAGLRILSRTGEVPHMMFMANPGSTAPIDAIRDQLLAFSAGGAGGEFFAGIGRPFGDMTGVTEEDMQTLSPLVRRLLARTAG